MAWYTYKCQNHNEFVVSLPKREKTSLCPKCGSVSSAIIKIGTTQITERLDNGVMGRAVERLHNIDEIIRQRSDEHDKIGQAVEFAGSESEESEE